MQKIINIAIAACLVACANNATIGQNTTNDGGGGGVLAANVTVKTSANGLLGYVLDGGRASVTILTPTGWIVQLSYAGSILSLAEGGNVYFSSAGCTGTPYQFGASQPFYGKSLIHDGSGNYYKPASSPANQGSVTATYNSYRTFSGTCTNSTWTGELSLLTTSSGSTEAGLPATITGPLVFEAP